MSTVTNNGAAAQKQPAQKQPAQKQPAQKRTLAAAATAAKVSKRKPVFRDVPGIPRVPLSDGTVGCVQTEVIITGVGADGTPEMATGPQMLTIPRKNADGTESGQRFPLASIQLLADGFRAAGLDLV